MGTIRYIACVGVLLTLVLAACSTQKDAGPSQAPVHFSCTADAPPSIGETAQAMAVCLPPHASSQEAAELLLSWQRADNHHWGGAASADLLPSNDAELILTYHADIRNVMWNPRGKIAILQAQPNGWQVVFESPDPTDQTTDGHETLDGNWSYHLAAISDLTGDGLDDLLVEQQWSDGHYASESHTKLFTADSTESAPLRIIYLENGTKTYPSYAVTDQTVQSITSVNGLKAITRTYQLDGSVFRIIERTINPKAAMVSAATADGATWYAYDKSCGFLCYQRFGLYRLQDGSLTHYDVPGHITSLQVLRDGNLYVGSTAAVFRMDQDGTLVDVLADVYAPVDIQGAWEPASMALTSDGDLWVAGKLQLAHFGRDHSTVHQIAALGVTLAPDDSAWVLGWNGQNPFTCCYYHVQKDQVQEYNLSESLPVSAELEQQIQAMRP